MELTLVLCLYVIFVLCLMLILYKYKYNTRAIVTISLGLGQILLNILKPPSDVDVNQDQMSSEFAFYLTIQFITPIILLFNVMIYALKDKRE